jgi:hypothetical protein
MLRKGYYAYLPEPVGVHVNPLEDNLTDTLTSEKEKIYML